jgi:hypothetical protein
MTIPSAEMTEVYTDTLLSFQILFLLLLCSSSSLHHHLYAAYLQLYTWIEVYVFRVYSVAAFVY